ncbi:CPBP family intramembrane glutamic endopeptidase [Sphingobacterium sp. UBA5670]|uniref:CPBP family intramembrane glutamic endopeptidase n=1 Tax=Sphingobacterium sp. UBA5670 TaxID=1947502 RepID=UPI0025D55FA0|nr:CPBP family intramembrane glutamic endopeptidase [Sphingobacterium sp. UBA5670]
MNNKNLNLLVLFLFFGIYFILDYLFFATVQSRITNCVHNRFLGHALTYSTSLLPLFLGAMLLKPMGPTGLLDKFGLNRSFIQGISFGMLTTLPMFLGYAFNFSFNRHIDPNFFLINSVSSGFFEEIIFRAYFFGLVFRYTRLGFIPAIFTTSMIFAFLHLYQSQDLGELALIFGITFLGSILFSWLYAEWKFNLWVPIALHIFMNSVWMIFDVADTAVGNKWSNFFRFFTIACAIAWTILQQRKTGLEIKGKKLWLKD